MALRKTPKPLGFGVFFMNWNLMLKNTQDAVTVRGFKRRRCALRGKEQKLAGFSTPAFS
jgi:hypothetical protein